MKRKIPSIMFSQHPDHASVPFWHKRALIKTHDELKECFVLLSQLAGQEVMWDWEGKLVDDSVIERLLSRYPEFFAKNHIGRDVFLTFRVPNPRIESGYRLGRAFMVILAAEEIAKEAGVGARPLFEVILPMTETATEMISLRESFKRIAEATHSSFSPSKNGGSTLEVVPIFESVESILQSPLILKEYLAISKKTFNEPVSYIRPFLARSDPALNSGIVATTLAIKQALSDYVELEKSLGVRLYPITAPGALPFRGGLTPDSVADFLDEFCGIRTLVIQGAFRYDYPKAAVQKALSYIQQKLHKTKVKRVSKSQTKEIHRAIQLFESHYKKSIDAVAPNISALAVYIPSRRERVQHIGLFGYSRQVGKHALPRAIGFTAAGYSLGIPPEFFGLAAALDEAKRQGLLEIVHEFYPGIKTAIRKAGRYVAKTSTLSNKERNTIEKFISQSLGPQTRSEKEHELLVSRIISEFRKGNNPHDLIEKAAILRKSIG
ncbi:phosphoenolpyruvate carboxylase [Candidatus Gottesmanbacteria bacterium RIFCSPLOWO2_01_FULL_43_11b]|uniref:Phosphoenolpyruvate carboxylase n=1 Tax=Candidatus Gottesmanbacteria bacterium RIFCSPLOWO2_01_FULL_43_11b TaxID=1798392 RepID=A0A1F6AG63_9BACT|nr:MAG: phosphoenolpyruvate carboxylase [Candidatus Gottesmanbacteria bacterium RIFCSPLOWO2_01_FULL_43_11b]